MYLTWGRSSSGRAFGSQSKGGRFESDRLQIKTAAGGFCIFAKDVFDIKTIRTDLRSERRKIQAGAPYFSEKATDKLPPSKFAFSIYFFENLHYTCGMNFLELKDVTFAYPPVEGDLDENGKQIVPPLLWEGFSADLPGGFVHLVGPNGCGKSTLLLLASGRLAPVDGSVSLLGKNPQALSEEERNLLASFIYQNMEFETDEKVENLLQQVYANGALKASAAPIRSEGGHKDLLSEVVEIFELGGVLNHPLTGLSKGEIQRVLLAFSILYGSKSIFMDEPMFAMELPQKEKSLAYLKDFVAKTGTTIYLSMHDLDLTRKYAEMVLLIYPNHDMDLGTPEEVLTNEDLEKAYGVPASMLRDGEEYTRNHLKEVSDLLGAKETR